MKHLILLGDGMADWPNPELQNQTLLQYADIPHMDWLAQHGVNGTLQTVPEGFHPGSEVANSSILGYDQNVVYEGRGPLEAASIGVELEPDDLALRCNLVCLQGTLLKNHSCGRLETREGDTLIRYLQEHLGNERIHFYTGVQYRHLLVIKGGRKELDCTPPHDIPLTPWAEHLPQALSLEAEETAQLLRHLMAESRRLLAEHPLNRQRRIMGMDPANSIWPWGGGYRPKMTPLTHTFPEVRSGAVITAVDLIRGIGHYAGLRIIRVPGATGLWDTNYEGKAQAAIDALRTDDFVYVHVEASDEAGHDGNLALKLDTIHNLDHRLLAPLLHALGVNDLQHDDASALHIDGAPVALALLPDHPTPVAHRTHTAEPVPCCICSPNRQPDLVQAFSEQDARKGSLGNLKGDEFIRTFMQ